MGSRSCRSRRGGQEPTRWEDSGKEARKEDEAEEKEAGAHRGRAGRRGSLGASRVRSRDQKRGAAHHHRRSQKTKRNEGERPGARPKRLLGPEARPGRTSPRPRRDAGSPKQPRRRRVAQARRPTRLARGAERSNEGDARQRGQDRGQAETQPVCRKPKQRQPGHGEPGAKKKSGGSGRRGGGGIPVSCVQSKTTTPPPTPPRVLTQIGVKNCTGQVRCR